MKVAPDSKHKGWPYFTFADIVLSVLSEPWYPCLEMFTIYAEVVTMLLKLEFKTKRARLHRNLTP